MGAEARPIPSRYLLHQEGLFGLIAVIGIGVQDVDPFDAFAPRTSIGQSIFYGICFGLAFAVILWCLRSLPALKILEEWQYTLVSHWSIHDVLAVAVLSGLAEEALLRVLVQPLIGLVPAAVIFALLHVLPDRRLWFWPLMALVIGIILGFLFEAHGFPAVAAAHMILNGIGLMRLVQPGRTTSV